MRCSVSSTNSMENSRRIPFGHQPPHLQKSKKKKSAAEAAKVSAVQTRSQVQVSTFRANIAMHGLGSHGGRVFRKVCKNSVFIHVYKSSRYGANARSFSRIFVRFQNWYALGIFPLATFRKLKSKKFHHRQRISKSLVT